MPEHALYGKEDQQQNPHVETIVMEFLANNQIHRCCDRLSKSRPTQCIVRHYARVELFNLCKKDLVSHCSCCSISGKQQMSQRGGLGRGVGDPARWWAVRLWPSGNSCCRGDRAPSGLMKMCTQATKALRYLKQFATRDSIVSM